MTKIIMQLIKWLDRNTWAAVLTLFLFAALVFPLRGASDRGALSDVEIYGRSFADLVMTLPDYPPMKSKGIKK